MGSYTQTFCVLPDFLSSRSNSHLSALVDFPTPCSLVIFVFEALLLAL